MGISKFDSKANDKENDEWQVPPSLQHLRQ